MKRYEAWYGNDLLVTLRMDGPGDMCVRIFERIVADKVAEHGFLKQSLTLSILVEDVDEEDVTYG